MARNSIPRSRSDCLELNCQMRRRKIMRLLAIFICLAATMDIAYADVTPQAIHKTIQPMMRNFNIPGVAVGVTIGGSNFFYNYGVMSRKTGQPVTNKTLFEIGSVSKVFTAALASYAQIDEKLSLSASVSQYLPSLRGSSFDKISLINLGTYTSGGLPLQLPNDISGTAQLLDYFKRWRPAYPVGAYRLYSNPSIGMLGMIAARSMGLSFDAEIEKKLFPELGMMHSFINVPADKMKSYAQGYTAKDVPIRLKVGALASEAYGMKSTTADLIRFVKVNMYVVKLGATLQRAITATHTGYFRSGEMTQDLVWEQYPYPVELNQVMAGNSGRMIYQANIATELTPPLQPRAQVLIDKTGSTNGFSTYIAFVPAKEIGVVILVNKNIPIGAMVTAGYQILVQMDRQAVLKDR